MRSAGQVSVLGVDPAKGDEAWRAKLGVVLQSWRDTGWLNLLWVCLLGMLATLPWGANTAQAWPRPAHSRILRRAHGGGFLHGAVSAARERLSRAFTMCAMLEAKKTGVFKSHYEIVSDGRPITTWEKSTWRTGGAFSLDGHRYEVRSNAWGTRYSLIRDDATMATAERVGRKRWSIDAGGHVHEFKRASMWKSEESLVERGRTVGYIKRPSMWRSNAVADLPGLPVPVQIFALTVTLAKWDTAAASSGG